MTHITHYTLHTHNFGDLYINNIFLFGKYALNGVTEIKENMWELFFLHQTLCCMIFLDENGPPPSKRPHSEVVRKQVNVKNDGLKYDEKGYVVVYTDGACENNGKTYAKGLLL